jgi:hypothetical protein
LRALQGARARARNIDRGDGTVRGAHEAVNYVARVKVRSRDGPLRVDAERKVPWPGAVPAPGASNVVMAPLGART